MSDRMLHKFAIFMSCLLLCVVTQSAAAVKNRCQYTPEANLAAFAPNDQHTFSENEPEPLSVYGNPSYYHVKGKRYTVLPSAQGYDKMGTASWYGDDFHGELTSNREQYDMCAMTAASKDLPLPTYVKVTNLENGRQVIVRVNDRGPFHKGRLIDLSYAAAKKLGFARKGTAMVRVTAISSPVSSHDDTPRAKQFIQIGAFHNQSNALKFRKHLANFTKLPIRLKADDAIETKLYRVQIGPFDDTQHLVDEQHHLKHAGFGHTIAVLG